MQKILLKSVIPLIVGVLVVFLKAEPRQGLGTVGFFGIQSQEAGVREQRVRQGEQPLVGVSGWFPLWAAGAGSCWGLSGEL